MLRIAGQTAGPIGLKCFVAGGCYRLKKRFFFKIFVHIHGQRRVLPLVLQKSTSGLNIVNPRAKAWSLSLARLS